MGGHAYFRGILRIKHEHVCLHGQFSASLRLGVQCVLFSVPFVSAQFYWVRNPVILFMSCSAIQSIGGAPSPLQIAATRRLQTPLTMKPACYRMEEGNAVPVAWPDKSPFKNCSPPLFGSSILLIHESCLRF